MKNATNNISDIFTFAPLLQDIKLCKIIVEAVKAEARVSEADAIEEASAFASLVITPVHL